VAGKGIELTETDWNAFSFILLDAIDLCRLDLSWWYIAPSMQ
jgi:hypothetical protein